MAGVVSALLRAGLAVKLGHLRQATSSYMQDRVEQGRTTVSGYVVGAAFYAVAGIFMIAALLVGAAALFRWVEMKYGTFVAFGVIGAGLVVLAALSAIIAASSLRPAKKSYPSLGNRLKAALQVAPPKATNAKTTNMPASSAATPTRLPAKTHDHIASARNTAASVLRAPSTPRSDASSAPPIVRSAGAAAAIGLIGWALSRRYSRPAAAATQVRRNGR